MTNTQDILRICSNGPKVVFKPAKGTKLGDFTTKTSTLYGVDKIVEAFKDFTKDKNPAKFIGNIYDGREIVAVVSYNVKQGVMICDKALETRYWSETDAVIASAKRNEYYAKIKPIVTLYNETFLNFVSNIYNTMVIENVKTVVVFNYRESLIESFEDLKKALFDGADFDKINSTGVLLKNPFVIDVGNKSVNVKKNKGILSFRYDDFTASVSLSNIKIDTDDGAEVWFDYVKKVELIHGYLCEDNQNDTSTVLNELKALYESSKAEMLKIRTELGVKTLND
jgi:hypothetical protein